MSSIWDYWLIVQGLHSLKAVSQCSLLFIVVFFLCCVHIGLEGLNIEFTCKAYQPDLLPCWQVAIACDSKAKTTTVVIHTYGQITMEGSLGKKSMAVFFLTSLSFYPATPCQLEISNHYSLWPLSASRCMTLSNQTQRCYRHCEGGRESAFCWSPCAKYLSLGWTVTVYKYIKYSSCSLSAHAQCANKSAKRESF